MQIAKPKSFARTFLIASFILVTVTVSIGCSESRKGPYERAGERVDEI